MISYLSKWCQQLVALFCPNWKCLMVPSQWNVYIQLKCKNSYRNTCSSTDGIFMPSVVRSTEAYLYSLERAKNLIEQSFHYKLPPLLHVTWVPSVSFKIFQSLKFKPWVRTESPFRRDIKLAWAKVIPDLAKAFYSLCVLFIAMPITEFWTASWKR